MEEQVKALICENKVIVIARRIGDADLLVLAKALFAGGMRLMEVTFDQAAPNCIAKTARQIAMLCQELGQSMCIGAGTVLNIQQLDAAQQAGAAFVISPNACKEVIQATKKRGLVSIPGAMTPTEIIDAHNWGADFVKVFPVGDLGIDYVRSIRSPLNHIKLIATGGIREENLQDYLATGIAGVGVSGCLTDKQLIATQDFTEITRRAQVFCTIAGTGKA